MKTKLLNKTKFLPILIFTLLLSFSTDLMASHFRYGNISWRKINSSTNQVEFTITQSWRRSAFFAGTPSIGNTFSNGDAFNFGDGSSVTITLTVTAVNMTDDWVLGEQKITKTYGSNGDFTAGFSGCCRLSSLSNAPDGSYSGFTVVNIGNTNNAPTSTMPPIINLQTGGNRSFTVPGADSDGDHLKWTLATSGDVSVSNPSQLSIDTFGNAVFNTTGLSVNGLYSCAVKISDGKTYTVVDFIVKIVTNSTAPAFDYGTTPSNGFTYNVSAGATVSFTVRATDADAGDVVTLSAVGIPSGATWSPGSAANPVSTSFSWTPTSGQVGSRVVVFTAQDNNGVQTQTSVTINVLSCQGSSASCGISVTPNSSVNTGGVSTNLYLGYGPTAVSLANTGGGASDWSGSANLSCTSCTTSVFTPTAAGIYTLSSKNCFGTCSVNICVKDIRVAGTSGSTLKVYIFHEDDAFPKSGKSEIQAVLVRGIPSHMEQHKKDKLGNGSYCANSKRDFYYTNVVIDEQNLEVSCTPNPFHQSFKLNYYSASEENATVIIYGMTGNLIQSINLASFADEVELGQNLSNGIYTVSFIQGDKNRVFRMIKVD